MGLNGFIVIDQAGTPLYSNLHYTKLGMQPALIAGFISAIQTFSTQLSTDNSSGISEMTMQNIKLLYRHLESYTFVGLIDPSDKIKDIEVILENIICAFLAKYHKYLCEDTIQDTAKFQGFDLFFEKWRAAKEKDLAKYCENSSPTLLQGTLNKLVNFFPTSDLLKINPQVLKSIGRKLIWVDTKISSEDESAIFSELRKRTDTIYGPGMFETVTKEVKKNLQTQELLS
ncbi:MAG TPA: hypothetical protein VKM55_12150 [Candidatus Lokiarchaeia archaeon]|nr:hypothetical protein [Candidatus Lokiarchaeia archaeon]